MGLYLKLIRWTNLIIVAATMYLIRYFVLGPLLENLYVLHSGQLQQLSRLSLQLPDGIFALLVFSTVLITAAGYAINDYFDAKTDLINKPEKVIIGKSLSRRTAMVLHSILNILGIAGGTYVAFYVKVPVLSLIFLLATGILWFYSTTYKKMLLTGNIIVAFLSATIPLMVALFEAPAIKQILGDILVQYHVNLSFLFIWASGFAFFAFATTLIREIIKDIEDFEGDEAFGRNTLPIVTGIKTSKAVVISLALITIITLWYVVLAYLNETYTILYVSVFISLPLLYIIYKTIKAKTKNNYHFISQVMKFIMLTGILYSFLAKHIITNQLL